MTSSPLMAGMVEQHLWFWPESFNKALQAAPCHPQVVRADLEVALVEHSVHDRDRRRRIDRFPRGQQLLLGQQPLLLHMGDDGVALFNERRTWPRRLCC